MPRIPEHPLHPTMCAWAEWMRAGGHDNQGWPGISHNAPERNEGGGRPLPCSRPPRQNPAPPSEWLRITRAMKALRRRHDTRAPVEAVMRYYVLREGGFDCAVSRGCDMLLAVLTVPDVD